MIRLENEGAWECFHCHVEYPNSQLYCSKCNATRKHSNNMRESLGFDAVARCRSPITDRRSKRSVELVRHKKLLEKYKSYKNIVERAILKLFEVADELGLEGNYVGFNDFEHTYTIKRADRRE